MGDLRDLVAALELAPTGEGRFEASHLDEGHGVVFGGQLLAQSLLAASRTLPDKQVLSLHTVFARGGSPAEPLQIDVDVMHAGRAFGSVTVTTTQSRGTCTRSLVLLHAPDADLIRHGAAFPSAAGRPRDHPHRPGVAGFWELRIVGDVDVSDPALVGPPELLAWSRFPETPSDLPTAQALLAYASDGFLIATAMRPHAGFGQAMAHKSVQTTVLAHTVTFHEPFAADDWLLLQQHSTYAGRGRTHGTANVFSEDGRHVASFTQDNMVRR